MVTVDKDINEVSEKYQSQIYCSSRDNILKLVVNL